VRIAAVDDPIHVFVDSNVWLAFYAYTNDDIEQLKKIVALVQNEKLKLYIPQQVVEEFYRNRERKLNESIRTFSKSEIPKSFPRYMLEYLEAEKYNAALAEFQTAKDELITRAKGEAEKKELATDRLFADILAASPAISVPDAIVDKAVRRRLRGNPPGASTSNGDQINWEVLLKEVPDETELHVVSNDGDFESKLIPGRADQFLIDEWKERKKADLSLHSELRPFLNAKFPDIKLAVDVEKQKAISALLTSNTFAETHYAVSRLKPLLDQLTWADADGLIDAALANNQVRWIGTDQDVRHLYSTIIERFGDQIDKDRLDELKQVITPKVFVVEEEDAEVPF
jgi:predicted nucleic acid-binding protein